MPSAVSSLLHTSIVTIQPLLPRALGKVFIMYMLAMTHMDFKLDTNNNNNNNNNECYL